MAIQIRLSFDFITKNERLQKLAEKIKKHPVLLKIINHPIALKLVDNPVIDFIKRKKSLVPILGLSLCMMLISVTLMYKSHTLWKTHENLATQVARMDQVTDRLTAEAEKKYADFLENKAVVENLDQLAEIRREIENRSETQAAGQVRYGYRVFIIMLGLCIFFTLAFIRNSKGNVSQEEQLRRYIKAVGEGDFTQKMELSGEESLASIGKELEAGLANVVSTLKEIKEKCMTFNFTSMELSTSSTMINQAFENMKDQSAKATSSIVEADQSMAEISSHSSDMSKDVEYISQTLKLMQTSFGEVNAKCDEENKMAGIANDKSQETHKMVTELTRATKEISKITGFIGDIASRTNLLALNAKIEAAAALDAGRGFAVVADEVKELAKKTAGAAKDISSQISHMQGVVNASVTIIDDVARTIQKVSTSSELVAGSIGDQTVEMEKVAKNSESATISTSEISNKVNSTSAKVNDIAENIKQMDQNVSDSSMGMSMINMSANNLKENADALNELIGKLSL